MKQSQGRIGSVVRGIVGGLALAGGAAPAALAQQWSQVDSATIFRGPEANGDDAYHSGRCIDVLPLASGDCLAAAETGGVWLAYTNGAAVPLSNDWTTSDVNCLASVFGSESHVLAGGNGLHVTDYTQANSLFHWIDVTPPASLNVGAIYRIASFNYDQGMFPRQCLALAASGGFFWCDLPPSPAGPYNWQPALGLPDPQVPCSGLAAGPAGSGRICVSLATVGRNAYLGQRAIHYGDFDTSGNLVFRPATINFQNPVDEHALQWTSLDSCSAVASRMYGVYFDQAKGECAVVLRSSDGGTSWSECSSTFDDGDPNNTVKTVAGWLGESENGGLQKNVAVHPLDPDRVHLAGLRPLATTDGGQHWRSTGGKWTSPGHWRQGSRSFHLDWHVARYGASFAHVFAATDGGLLDAASSIPPTDFSSAYNAHLHTLQHYSHPARGFAGSCDFSQLVSGLEGLCSSGTQDNANIGDLIPEAPPAPWTAVTGGDGGWNTFIETDRCAAPRLICNTNGGSPKPSHHIEYSGGSWIDRGIVLILSDQNGKVDPFGLASPVVFKVNVVAMTDSMGNDLFAVAAGCRYDTNSKQFIAAYNQIYGLFADPVTTYPVWEYLGDVGNGDSANSLASWDGREVVIGTGKGTIRYLQTSTGTSSAGSINVLPGGLVYEFALTGPSTGFAIYSNLGNDRGTVIERIAGGSGTWQPSPNVGLTQLTLYDILYESSGAVTPALYVCSDRKVFTSTDGAATWTDYSAGLPARPHGATLHSVCYPDGELYLYLSTYGRSTWRTRLTHG